VLVGVGQSRTFDFVADAPGDWPMHCHMTHHAMTQMGDNFPNTIGVQPGKLDQKIRASLLPGYMTMGENGMGDMAEMGMAVPRNSTPMVGGQGPFDYITMGGLFTARGSANLLTRATAILATLFMVNSLALGVMASREHQSRSVLDQEPISNPFETHFG